MSRYSSPITFSLIWLIFLHLFRNLSPVFILVQGIILLLSIALCCRYLKILKHDILDLVFIFILFYYVIILSLIYDGEFGDSTIGIFRFSSFIVTFLAALIVFKNEKVDQFWMIFSIFSAICALSLYYQFIFGAIEWFAESSERAGFSRYASLAGSLTIYGVICGMAIISSYFYFSGWQRLVLIIVIVSGGFISLQKAAIANIVIAAIGIAIVEKISFWKLIKNFLILFFVASIVLWITGLYDIATIGFTSSLGAADESIQSDVSILQSAFDRLVELPGIVFDFYGFDKIFWGMGVFGGAGSLGYSELPMMHNAFFDIVAIAGVPVFTLSLFYFIFLFFKACKNFVDLNQENSAKKVSILIFFMSILNMFFASGNFFQPVIAFVLWLTVIYVSRIRT